MSTRFDTPAHAPQMPADVAALPVNVSRRGFLGAGAALVLATTVPLRPAKGQQTDEAAQGPAVQAFLEIRSDGTVRLKSPFIEGGQGVYTSSAQIVGEELDLAPENFVVESAPAGGPFGINGGFRITGGSASTRASYTLMRTLGASARAMLITAAAQKWGVPEGEITTEPGQLIHAGSGRAAPYGALAETAMGLAVPAEVALKNPADFRWIKTPVARLDVRAKSTGQATYGIDVVVENMLNAAVRHAPRLGLTPETVDNLAEIEAMRGVHSVHLLDGAVAVVAEKFWQAKRAIDAAEITWAEGDTVSHPLPADFSSTGFRDRLAIAAVESVEVEATGDATRALEAASEVISATYDAPFLVHGQLEPPTTTARFNDDGTLDLWVSNQAPEQYMMAAAQAADVPPQNVRIHSPLLGGFFGRHFRYDRANNFPQAIALAKATGRPVKLIWTREEDFLRDAPRPLGLAKFKGTVGAHGIESITAEVVGEGPTGRWYGAPPGRDPSATEGISGKAYALRHARVGHSFVPNPTEVGYWRSVGHSMHDFMYESFFDEMAEAAGQDPFEARRALLSDNARLTALLDAVAELSGGWRRGPFEAEDGSMRARGIAMASPFGTEVAAIAEVSVAGGEVVVHDIWTAIDPGQIVNPAIVEAQVQSAVALGVGATLVEELVYEAGAPTARNFDVYEILRPHQMPRVHTQIIESGAQMGGVGEPGLPAVPPAITNAVAALTGIRARSLPLSKYDFG